MLHRCQEGTLTEQDWRDASQRFSGIATDSNDIIWDQAHQVFYDNKTAFQYNIARLQTLESPIAKLQGRHICVEANNKDSQEANGLQSFLYLARGADVMLTSNLLTPVGLHNGARGKVIDFVYNHSDGPRAAAGFLPEAVVVQFSHLVMDMPPFLDYYPGSVAIPTINAEWTRSSGNGVLTRTQFPLSLSWAFTIHKSQGKTLDHVVIDLGTRENCSGLTLVALSRVRMLMHFLLKPISFDRMRKVNSSPGLIAIKNAIAALKVKAANTKMQYPDAAFSN